MVLRLTDEVQKVSHHKNAVTNDGYRIFQQSSSCIVFDLNDFYVCNIIWEQFSTNFLSYIGMFRNIAFVPVIRIPTQWQLVTIIQIYPNVPRQLHHKTGSNELRRRHE